MNRPPVSLYAILLAIIAIAAMFVINTASAAEPTPANIHVSAEADETVTGFVKLTVTISNSGQTDSELVSMVTNLPDHDWLLSGDNWPEGDCSVQGDQLTGSGFLEKRHLNSDSTEFVNGTATCTVVAQLPACGQYSASPFALHKGSIIIGNKASWASPCPTAVVPTATPTQAVPTATPAPPTPTVAPPTPTPQIVVVTATPTSTPFRVAPLPPNTGSGHGEHGIDWPSVVVYLGLMGFVIWVSVTRQ